MYVIRQGSSILIPATVTGDKNAITTIEAKLKLANPGGGIPESSDATIGTFTITDYTSAEVTDGYLLTLEDTSSIAPGTYYVNYKYTIGTKVFKGTPMKILIQESVV